MSILCSSLVFVVVASSTADMVVDAESWRKRVGLGIGSGRRKVLSAWGMLGTLQTLSQSMVLVHGTPSVNQSAKRDCTLDVCRALPGGSSLYSGAGKQCVAEAPKEYLYMDKTAVLAGKYWWISTGGVQEEYGAGICEFLLLRWNPDRSQSSGFLLLLQCLRCSTTQ